MNKRALESRENLDLETATSHRSRNSHVHGDDLVAAVSRLVSSAPAAHCPDI
jgi:hypothetical protein